MAHPDYDMTILGGGSGGLTAARLAASLGAKVLLIDKERLGGDCLYAGCVPSKSLIHIARVVQQTREASSWGLVPTPFTVDMGRVSHMIEGVIGRVAANEAATIEGITVKFGQVQFASNTDLLLNGSPLTSRTTIVATGSHPLIPHIEGLEQAGYITNEQVFHLTHLPRSLVVVGGGPIGVELGQALARLGTQVTIIEGLDRLLPREEPEVSAQLTEVLQSEGVTILTGATFVQAGRNGKQKRVIAQQGNHWLTVEADEILVTLGRRPNVDGLNLEVAGVKYDHKGIRVDEYLQTTTPTIFALGDVIGGYLFTHVAAYQAGVAVRNALVPLAKKKVDYRVVPWCTFTDPEVARVGLTEHEAQQQYQQTRVVKLPYNAIDRAQAELAPIGFLKLILAGKKDEVVGAHIIGRHAGELLGELALVMQHHLPLSALLATIHAYPTMQTGIQQAAFEAYLEGTVAKNNRNIVRTLLTVRGTW